MANSIGTTVAVNLLLGLSTPRLDTWAHLGGLVAGGIMAYAFGPRLYLSDMPKSDSNTGDTVRVVIDRPICTVPKFLESIPGKVGRQWKSLTSFIVSKWETKNY
jgi:hypothetical protein